MVWIPYQHSKAKMLEIKHFKTIPLKMEMNRVKKTLENKDRVLDEKRYAALQAALENAVKKNIPANETFGIAFSGGLDSGIIAHVARKFSKKIVLLVVGTKESKDVARAKMLAQQMKMKIVVHVLNEKEIMENYARAEKILNTHNYLQCTLGAVNLAIAKLAQDEGLKHVFVGSGADELFCGYAVFDAVRNDSEACEKLREEKVKNVHVHDVEREKKCAEKYAITLQAPFLDDDFAKRAMEIPAIENLKGKYGGLRKNVLRMLGEQMNVPEEIVRAPKKAMQYGSGVSKWTKKMRKIAPNTKN